MRTLLVPVLALALNGCAYHRLVVARPNPPDQTYHVVNSSALGWNASEQQSRSFDTGDYVKARGKVQIFQGATQLILTQVEPASGDAVDPGEFLPRASRGVAEMTARLRQLLMGVSDPHLRALAECFLIDDDFVRRFGTAPAGIRIHHAYQGGLLEHVTRTVEVECLPGDIPEHLDVDISELHLNQNVAVSALVAGDKVKILTDPETILAVVAVTKEEEVAAAPAEGEAAATPVEPEVAKKGKVAKHVRALIVPGSQVVAKAAEAEGLHEIFQAAGFQWRKAGCSMCLGMNDDKLQGREMSASSSNRNFIGRQGSPTGRTLLMSPAMVAAAAINGVVTDVREVLK